MALPGKALSFPDPRVIQRPVGADESDFPQGRRRSSETVRVRVRRGRGGPRVCSRGQSGILIVAELEWQ